jgi:hypothetical protein
MLLRSKTLLLLICLVLILFKTAAGSIFIQSAIERAELAGSYSNTSISQQAHDGNSADAADDKEQVHTMYLMSHVTANISETRIAISPPRVAKHKFVLLNEALFTQNFPDSAFKPPKAKA